MKPKQFVTILRSKCESEIVKHYEYCKTEAPGLFGDIDLKGFIKMAANKPPRRFDIRRRVIENRPFTGWLEFEIDGAFYKIANIPTALCHVYRHASKAL